jgi:hypothetical protein
MDIAGLSKAVLSDLDLSAYRSESVTSDTGLIGSDMV